MEEVGIGLLSLDHTAIGIIVPGTVPLDQTSRINVKLNFQNLSFIS